VQWSHELLSEPERILFRRLACIANGWTLEFAERVCSLDGITQADVLDLLAQLVESRWCTSSEDRARPGTDC
jgi:predicted ATPase